MQTKIEFIMVSKLRFLVISLYSGTLTELNFLAEKEVEKGGGEGDRAEGRMREEPPIFICTSISVLKRVSYCCHLTFPPFFFSSHLPWQS